jgi:alcohol oxidase
MPNADASKAQFIRAKKLVVISSGTFGSPQILERSGIGGKSVLEKAGVKQIVDLPGVGEHFQGGFDRCY